MAPPRPEWDPDYLARKAQLPEELRLELDLVEEWIISDPKRTYQRTFGDDGVVYDFSGYDKHGLTVAFVPSDEVYRFIGFTVRP